MPPIVKLLDMFPVIDSLNLRVKTTVVSVDKELELNCEIAGFVTSIENV